MTGKRSALRPNLRGKRACILFARPRALDVGCGVGNIPGLLRELWRKGPVMGVGRLASSPDVVRGRGKRRASSAPGRLHASSRPISRILSHLRTLLQHPASGRLSRHDEFGGWAVSQLPADDGTTVMGGEAYSARNCMSAVARTSVFPEAALVGALSPNRGVQGRDLQRQVYVDSSRPVRANTGHSRRCGDGLE